MYHLVIFCTLSANQFTTLTIWERFCFEKSSGWFVKKSKPGLNSIPEAITQEVKIVPIWYKETTTHITINTRWFLPICPSSDRQSYPMYVFVWGRRYLVELVEVHTSWHDIFYRKKRDYNSYPSSSQQLWDFMTLIPMPRTKYLERK